MNKFSYNPGTLKSSFGFSLLIGIAILLASDLSNTPRYISFLLATIASLVPYLHLAFIERDEVIINKWLLNSAVTFFQLFFMAGLAYGDLIVFETY
ncbi:MAG: hypothetical protein DRG78_05910 [Epsilonproteobacteria bacterium]|nr:MAG: hypothetical protein DRG78_05910 [Campylobacterota bacterium]